MSTKKYDHPVVHFDLQLGEIEDQAKVLDVVHQLLSEDEIIDQARPAAQILGYALDDLRGTLGNLR